MELTEIIYSVLMLSGGGILFFLFASFIISRGNKKRNKRFYDQAAGQFYQPQYKVISGEHREPDNLNEIKNFNNRMRRVS